MVTIIQSSSMLQYMRLVAEQFEGRKDGELCLLCIRYETDEDGEPILEARTGKQKTTVREKWVKPSDDWEKVAAWARARNRDHFNIYMSWSLFRNQTRSKQTVVASAAFVADWDDQPRKVLLKPTLEVRTSPGRQQDIFIHEPIEFDRARDLYRGVARALGCDLVTSGDASHVWRVPGSQNWPRADKNRDPSPSSWKREEGEVVSVKALERLKPEEDDGPRLSGDGDVDDWPERRHGKPVKRWVKEALSEDADIGERSEKFHRIVLAIAECGWGTIDIVEMLEGTNWAVEKFGSRLAREVERSISKGLDDGKLSLPKAKLGEGGLQVMEYTPNFKERKITWLWYPYIPRGEVTLLDGDGGVGKTTMMLRVSYDAIVGGEMPNEYRMRGGAKVLYISLEADAEGVTMPVLKRMGLKETGGFYHVKSVIELDDEGISEIEQAIKKYQIDLVVIDSLVDYLPSDSDMNDYKEASKMGLYLRERIAQPHNCAVVLMRHLTKGSKDKMRYRGMGSQGWHKGARSQLIADESEEDEGCRVVVQTKSTYAHKGPSLLYGFKEIDGRGTVEWLGLTDEDERSMTASQAGRSGKNDQKPDKEGALSWLRDYLDDGKGHWSNELFEEAEKRGFNERLLRFAARELNVKIGPKVKLESGRGTRTEWKL